jgi:hypothetical protein
MNNSKYGFLLLIWEEANKKFVQEALMLIGCAIGSQRQWFGRGFGKLSW